MKSALIIGSEGQDGVLLSKLLSSKGYRVIGISKSNSPLRSQLAEYLSFDLSDEDFGIIGHLIKSEKPSEVYYLAAYHHSSQQSDVNNLADITKSFKVNHLGFLKVLELCRKYSPDSKIFYASSSLVFSGSDTEVQDELTKLSPTCFYSLSKSAAMDAAALYRKMHNSYVSIGILYNHESIYRKEGFLSRKLIDETKRIHQSINKDGLKITVGSLSSVTDWGYAPDFVKAMWHILQQPYPDDFIISSGKGHRVLDWFETIFSYLGMNWRDYVIEDPLLLTRKKPILIGNNNKLLATGFTFETGFKEMVLRMFSNNI